jgi:hypothetical protein
VWDWLGSRGKPPVEDEWCPECGQQLGGPHCWGHDRSCSACGDPCPACGRPMAQHQPPEGGKNMASP